MIHPVIQPLYTHFSTPSTPIYSGSARIFVPDPLLNRPPLEFTVVQPRRIELLSTVLQTAAMTTSAKVANLVPEHGFEPRTLSV